MDIATQATWFHGTRRAFPVPAPGRSGLIHFSADIHRAAEYAGWSRQGSAPGNDTFRIIEARLAFSRPFDPRSMDVAAALCRVDWDAASRQMQDFAQSPDWPPALLRRWAREGRWQIYELPAVLVCLRGAHDALVMEELGDWGIAVFDSSQVSVAAVHTEPPPALPSRRGRTGP